MRRVLVLRGGALGDFIVTLPALAALRARWPAARIELVGNATAAALAKNRGWLDAVHPQHEARWAGLYGAGPLAPELAAWLADFDLVVNFWPDPDGELQRRFPLHPRQTFLTAAAWPASVPAARHYLDALGPLGMGAIEPRTTLRPLPGISPSSDFAPLVIHPGSGSPRKNWPAAAWRQLIRELGRPVALVLGEAEAAHWSNDLPPLAAVWRQPELETLVARLAGGGLFLGHDSGISHLAAACGRTCVLLFGPTDPAMWAPPFSAVTVLRRGNTLEQLSVAEVLAAVRATPMAPA